MLYQRKMLFQRLYTHFNHTIKIEAPEQQAKKRFFSKDSPLSLALKGQCREIFSNFHFA